MKALVLSGGTGIRLRPLTFTTTKQLLPVANRPILFYIMDIVKEAGIKTTGIVVSPEWGEQVKQVIGDGSRWGMVTSYIVQPRPAGLADAVRIARSFLRDSPFLMVLGDNVYKWNARDFVAQFQKQKVDALLLLMKVDDPAGFGIARLDSDGRVIEVQEKPPEPKSNLALAGIYLFSPAIHEAIDDIKPSRRGELEITDAIQKLIEMKRDVRGYVLDGWWLDTGDTSDLLKANRAVLSEFLRPSLMGSIDSKSKIEGKVEIMEGAVVEGSVIQGPASIAENCIIRNSSVGPFTSIGPNTVVDTTTIEDSIVLANCQIRGVANIKSSLLGRKSVVKNSNKGVLSLLIGDDTRLEM